MTRMSSMGVQMRDQEPAECEPERDDLPSVQWIEIDSATGT